MTITKCRTISIFITNIFLFILFVFHSTTTEHVTEHKVLENENVNSSVCNEAEQMTARTRATQANDDVDDGGNGNASQTEQIMRVSDALGYEDVVLRPKSEHHNNRRLARPLAVLSGLFKSHRESGANQEENASANSKSVSVKPSCAVVDNKIDQKKSKKKPWNIFKSKKKHRDESPSFQHFQQPLNIEHVSLSIGPCIDSDAEWYDLNREEMSLFEAQVSDIVNEFNNANQVQMIGDSEPESMYQCDLNRYFTISTNILWSHNLSVSCQSNSNASNINLLGANINRDQIHSDVFIEDGESDDVCAFNKGLNSSFVSTDSHGYTIMQPTKKNYQVGPTVLIDDITTKKPTTDCDYHSDNSSNSNLSSGFGSDSDGGNNTPQKSIAFVASPATSATSDFSEAFASPATATATTPLTEKSMQKPSKKCRLQIRSRKLLGMLYAKHTPSQSNVTATPPNKSSPECMKKVHKGTPFKVRLSNREEAGISKKSRQPLHSIEI